MEIKLEEVREWFAQKSNKKVIELDMYDMFCAKVAYDYACERLLDVVGRSEQLQPEQKCYKSEEPCKYNCSGLCKESC